MANNDDFNFDDEYADDEEKQQRRNNYNRAYLDAIKRQTDTIEDEGEREEVLSELSQHHNVIRSGNPFSDSEHNLLLARQGIEDRNKSMDSHTKSYMDYLDRRDGKGTGAKKLKKAHERESAYLDHIEGRLR